MRHAGLVLLSFMVIACAAVPQGEASQTPSSGPADNRTTRPTDDPAEAFVEVTDPILGILPASSVDDTGRPVDPGFAFPPDAPLITVIVRTGQIDGSPLEFTWNLVGAQGDQELFSHTVEVSSFDRAFSVGKNPGTLLAGLYRVDVTLEGQARAVSFEVVDGDAPDGATGEVATAAPPAGGESGSIGAAGEGGESGVDCDGRDFRMDFPNGGANRVDLDASRVEFEIVVCGIEGTVNLSAGAEGFVDDPELPRLSGPRYEISFGPSVRSFALNPCAVPGVQSDLPGALVRINAEMTTAGVGVAGANLTVTLGPDRNAPILFFPEAAGVPDGSMVEPGQQLALFANASEPTFSWQTGVQRVQITANPGGIVGEPGQASSRLPKPCAQKQWELETEGVYTVPDPAPPEIEICAIAEDYRPNDSTKCIHYYTAEVWTGTMSGTTSGFCDPSDVNTYEGPVRLVVDSDGKVDGTWSLTTTVTQCGETATVTSEEQRFPGRKTANGFELPGFVVERLTIDGTVATGTWRDPGGFPGSVAIRLECASCSR
jgi:hypothetical protein